MYNITKGNVVPMKATLVHEEERFPVAISTDISVRIYNEYRYIDAINIVVDGEEDGVIYFDIPDTLNSGTFGVEVKGKSKGYNWRTATDNVVKITRSTEKEEGSEAIPEGDTYDIVMTVQLYKQQSPQEAIDEHNNDEEAHPYILDKINEVEGKIPVLPDHIVTDENYVHTDNNYTNEEKEKLANLENYDDSGIRQELDGKVDKVQGKGLSTNDFTNEDKAKLNSALQSETDPTVPQWAKQPNKPTYSAQEVGALPNSTKYGSTIDLTMDSATYVLTLSLKDQDGTVLNTKTVDLPIESVVVNGRYDATNKKIVLTLQSGSTIDVPVGDLVAGLQTEITSVNMLSADLVDDTNSAHKFVTAQEKQNWNNKSDFSGDYNDLANKPTIPTVPTNVSAFANDAGYLTEHQDISGKVDKEQGKGLSTNDYTTQEKNKLASLENYDDTQVRQLIAQTNANFANYYTKSESYSANEVDTLLRTQRQGQYVVVATLPTASADTMFKIYLVPSTDPQTSNIKDEYVTLEGNGSYYWEQIGSTAVDLSNYSTTAEMNAAIATALNAYYTKSEVDTALSNKQDTISDLNNIRNGASAGSTAYQKPNTGIPSTDMSQAVQTSLSKADTAIQLNDMNEAIGDTVDSLENGNIIPAMAETLEPWADQKAIATPDTYTDAVRTTGGDIPIETSAGSKLESIKPVAGSKWTAKMLFNGSYNMLNAAKWGDANSQPYVGGVGSDFVYFLVPELTLGTFGTADENNGLLFTDSEGENIQPASVYYKPLGNTVPQSLTDGTLITPTTVNYDGKTYKDYATSGAGWLIVPKTIYDNDVCAHIAWEDWYDKYVSLNEPTTNPEAVVGTLILEGLLALVHADKYLRGVNEETCDNVVFGDTSATITHMVDELSVAANAWTNAATGESDSQGNALYRHSATVSLIKQGGAACIEGENGGIPLTVNGTTVSYVDTNTAAPASTVFYEVASTSTTKAYTDSIFDGSNINQETGILPINDCSIEAQVAMDGKADITVKYAKNIVDQVAINATVDVPQIKKQVEEHEERIVELEDTAVRTCSYDASVSVGLADNLRGDAIVSAEFYKRKTGGTQSVGSGIAALKEIRGKSIVWNQLVDANTTEVATISAHKYLTKINGVTSIITSNGSPIAINDASVDQVFDLTLMMLPSISVANFEKMFPLHYDYNDGEIIPFAGQNLVTTGKNQYNPATGKANLLGGQTYQIGGNYTSAEIDGVAVTLDSNNCFTTTKDCVLDITGGNDTNTFVSLYDGETNTYEPYEKHTLPLDPSQWRDKQGNLVFPYGGMHGYTNVYDYAKVDADGYIRKAVRRFGVKDLGTVSWSVRYNKNGTVGFSTPMNDWGTYIGYKTPKYCICSKYYYSISVGYMGSDSFTDKSAYFRAATSIIINDSSYTSASKFKTDMSGVMLYYQLETPVEVELATPVYAKYLVDKDGTEEITPANGTTPYTTMANLSILYAMDARGTIANLPKNFLSKESTENMLNAMVSAGVIASYTMTYDAANARYQFTIVKA